LEPHSRPRSATGHGPLAPTRFRYCSKHVRHEAFARHKSFQIAVWYRARRRAATFLRRNYQDTGKTIPPRRILRYPLIGGHCSSTPCTHGASSSRPRFPPLTVEFGYVSPHGLTPTEVAPSKASRQLVHALERIMTSAPFRLRATRQNSHPSNGSCSFGARWSYGRYRKRLLSPGFLGMRWSL